MEHILKAYQRRLLNLSANNRALLLRRLSTGLHLDLQDLDFVLGKAAFELLREIITGKKSIPLAPLADSRQATVAPLSRKLQAIFRQAEMLKEERGAKELFVGWPFVRGKFNDGSTVRCPLLFFPVALEKTAQTWVLKPTGSPFLNKNFLLAYAHFNQLTPDDELLNSNFSDFPEDALEFRTALYELLKNSGLELNFNREIFEDKTIAFPNFTKPDFDKAYNPGELKLFPEAVLGIFPQAGSYLMADYDALLDRTDWEISADIFAHHTEVQNQPTRNFEQNTFAVFDLDASQENILQEVKKGKSVVVQGPPGTGKSQLICNLVTDFTARGKTVWVVCQKRAALEVVQQRLAAKGFGNFTALVHDSESDRRKIFDQLKRQIEEIESYKKQNNQFSLVVAERQFLEISRRLNQILQTLTDFKTALFDTGDCGWSAKELYLKSNLQQELLPLEETFEYFTAETLPFFLSKLQQFLAASQQFDNPDFVLADRKSLANRNWKHLAELKKTAQEVATAFQGFHKELPLPFQKKYSAYPAWQELKKQHPELKKLAELLAIENLHPVFVKLFSTDNETVKAQEKSLTQLEKFYATKPPVYGEAELHVAERVLQNYCGSRQSILKKIGWNLKAENQKILQKSLGLYELNFTDIGLSELQNKLRERREILQIIRTLNGLQDNSDRQLSEDLSLDSDKLKLLKNAFSASKIAGKLVRSKWLEANAKTVAFQVKKLLALLSDLEQKTQSWQQYLTETQIQNLAENKDFQQEFISAISEHFEAITAHDLQFLNFSEAEKMVARLLQKLPGDAANKVAFFEKSVYLHWLFYLEEKFPVLKLAGEELNKLETELQNLLGQKQALTHQIVATRLRERTYNSLEKNRLGNVVSYRKLYAQVSKKRNLFSLRKLHNLFAEEIADLVPCWLASPETISALFPVSHKVDLVIFDEASQAFAEHGLPAISRAAQVVIAGDEHQLGPTDLYRSRWQTDDEETEELIVESLLALGSLHLPQHWLTQHYRSRFPELIEFSNAHFYRHKLQLIPDFKDLEKAIPAIQFRQINGLWKVQTNLPEAEKVTELLFQLLREGQQNIGIITFNFAQQNLVQDLVEKYAQENQVLIPDSVLIKNIENMQGDEKQVIILSVGYAPDEHGKLNVQFGSLSQAKGENRLNVAITRAISKLYVFCSFGPEQLKVENTKNEGPKLLKDFLLYARKVSEGDFDWKQPETAIQAQVFYLKTQLQNDSKMVAKISEKLPFADLTLEKDQHVCHLIRTDDDLYFGQISARQTHTDVPFLLQKRNWPYSNFYSRQFWLNPDKLRLQVRNLC